MTRRVAVIGAGAIGRIVIDALAQGRVAGAELVAVVNDAPVLGCPAEQLSLVEAIGESDVVVECASQAVITRHGAEILNHGRDLLVTSVGAMADPVTANALKEASPGRMLITAGAVGGIDLLASAAAHGPIHRASVTTTKLPRTLLQPWMDDATQEALLAAREPVEVFHGSAANAARCFPRSLNVAATVGFAIGDLDLVDVRLVADPAAELTSHEIQAEGVAGRYRFEIRNRPSTANPRTSGVVPQAILRSLSVLIGQPAGIF